jgi:hypothetical protein
MDRRDRPDQPTGPNPRPWSGEDLRARLDRLPPNHPSFPRYNPGTPREPLHPHDNPRRADQQPERLRPWYTPHATREQHIERQRRDHAPTADPRQWRDDWYRQRYGQVPAPFREEVAERVATVSRRTKGRLDRHDGGDGLPLESGYKTGLVDALEHATGQLPEGFASHNRTHAEAHAAAWLHLNPHIRKATIYINRRPCDSGCREGLSTMIPEGCTLTVYAPEGFWRVYHGQHDQEGAR